MKIQFLGAAQTVTGSKTLLKYRGKNILVDCGLFQGDKSKRELNWNSNIDAKTIDFIILTHAHIDHSGFLPKLVKDGFRGNIYCSSGTFDLCKILLLDSARLQEEDANYANKTGYSNHKPALPLYTSNDAEKTLEQFRILPQNQFKEIFPTFSIKLSRSGHITGSTFVQIYFLNDQEEQRILTFSGDLGTSRSPIMKPPVTLSETDYLVIESTYGDRERPNTLADDELQKIILESIHDRGVLLIPAFAVGRTQEILFYLRKLEDENKIPKIPILLDSPMAEQATEVFLNHPEDYQMIEKNNHLMNPIQCSYFKTISSIENSKKLNSQSGPMIIISSAGMLTGGRIMHHLKQRLPEPNNTLLFVGFQAEGTKGRVLLDGAHEIRIHHEPVSVNCKIKKLDHFSAHADQQEILKWIRSFHRIGRQIFINHGEPHASEKLKQELEKIPHPANGLIIPQVNIPTINEIFTLS